MGNFEKLSVLVIVVIIVMILVVAIYTWQENPAGPETAGADTTEQPLNKPTQNPWGSEPNSGEPNSGEPDDPRPDVPLPPAVDPVPPNVDVPPIDIPVPRPEGPQGRIADNIDPEVDNEPWIHEVQSGQVLGGIAQKYLGTTGRMNAIIAMNPGMDPDHLRIGQKIKMPPRGQVGPAPRRGGNVGPGNVGPGPVRGGDPVAGSTYTTRRGDRLDNIAKLAYGNVERWPELFAINKEKVTNPFRLDEGVQLKLPR